MHQKDPKSADLADLARIWVLIFKNSSWPYMSLDMSSREALEGSLSGLHLQLTSKAGSVDMRNPRQKKAVLPTFLLTENITKD